MNHVEDAELYAKTVSVFYHDRTLDYLLRKAWLDGYDQALKQHKIKDKNFSKQTKNEQSLFEWKEQRE